MFRSFSVSENEYLVVNAVGPDRPGIVSDFTKLVVDQGGNVGESQASRIGEHFGLMMLITVPKSQSEDLQKSVKAMTDMSTTCYLTGDPSAIEVTPKNGCKFCLRRILQFLLVLDSKRFTIFALYSIINSDRSFG